MPLEVEMPHGAGFRFLWSGRGTLSCIAPLSDGRHLGASRYQACHPALAWSPHIRPSGQRPLPPGDRGRETTGCLLRPVGRPFDVVLLRRRDIQEEATWDRRISRRRPGRARAAEHAAHPIAITPDSYRPGSDRRSDADGDGEVEVRATRGPLTGATSPPIPTRDVDIRASTLDRRAGVTTMAGVYGVRYCTAQHTDTLQYSGQGRSRLQPARVRGLLPAEASCA